MDEVDLNENTKEFGEDEGNILVNKIHVA